MKKTEERHTARVLRQVEEGFPDGTAHGFMRERPLVLVLDEPTAALDAETEHALFERYDAAVREDVA